jgi:hypothetical protein
MRRLALVRVSEEVTATTGMQLRRCLLSSIYSATIQYGMSKFKLLVATLYHSSMKRRLKCPPLSPYKELLRDRFNPGAERPVRLHWRGQRVMGQDKQVHDSTASATSTARSRRSASQASRTSARHEAAPP